MTGRRAESKRRNREALLAAARDLFLAHGYHEVGIQAIATTAGLTIGAIYSLFGSKQDLLLAVLADLSDAVATELRALAERPELDAQQVVTRHARTYHRSVSTVDGWRVLRLEVDALTVLLGGEDPEQALAKNATGSQRVLAELLTGRELAGARLTPARAERAAAAVTAVLRGLAMQQAVRPGAASADRWAKLAVAVLQAS